jgi:uncharacterized protein
MKYEWDEAKNSANIAKHGISFEEASEIFNDPMMISKLDLRYEYGEERWFSVGSTKKGMITMVAHLYFDEHQEPVIRIISARKATQKEAQHYA